MSEKNLNFMMLMVALVIIVMIAAKSYDHFELSVASIGLNISAGSNDTTFVNLPLVVQELESPKA